MHYLKIFKNTLLRTAKALVTGFANHLYHKQRFPLSEPESVRKRFQIRSYSDITHIKYFVYPQITKTNCSLFKDISFHFFSENSYVVGIRQNCRPEGFRISSRYAFLKGHGKMIPGKTAFSPPYLWLGMIALSSYPVLLIFQVVFMIGDEYLCIFYL